MMKTGSQPKRKRKISTEKTNVQGSSSVKPPLNGENAVYLSPERVENSEPEDIDQAQQKNGLGESANPEHSKGLRKVSVWLDTLSAKKGGTKRKRDDVQENTEAESLPGGSNKSKQARVSGRGIGKSLAEVNQQADAQRDPSVESSSEAGDSTPHQIATSTARRTRTSSEIPAAIRAQNKLRPEPVDHPPESDSETTEEQVHRLSKNNVKITDKTTCASCKKEFSSERSLRRHIANPKSHSSPYQCSKCDQIFPTKTTLVQHEVDARHAPKTGIRRTGQFTSHEMQKLGNWQEVFCDEYEINSFTFNEMMVDSLRQKKDDWSYRFISRDDFLNEYYAVLPDRDRRSMRRHRERAYQNIEKNKPWTDEDDQELIDLHKKLGPKWVKIGDSLLRDADEVFRRWKNKLKFQGQIETGSWSQAEVLRLRDAVTMLKKERNLAMDETTDNLIPWSAVSKALDSTRTGQQCSNHWRTMNLEKIKGQFKKRQLLPHTPVSTSKTVGLDGDDHAQAKDVQPKIVPKSASKASRKDPVGRQNPVQRPKAAQAATTSEEVIHDPEVETSTPANRRRPNLSTKGIKPKTPRGQSGSQLFAQTQADSSVVRDSIDVHRFLSQPARPSPGLPLQHRRHSSPADETNDELLQEKQSSGIDEQEARLAQTSSKDGDAPKNDGGKLNEAQPTADEPVDTTVYEDAQADDSNIILNDIEYDSAPDVANDEPNKPSPNTTTDPTSSSGSDDQDSDEAESNHGGYNFSSADAYILPEASSDSSSDSSSSDDQSEDDENDTASSGAGVDAGEDDEESTDDNEENDKDSLIDATEGDYKRNDFMSSIQATASQMLSNPLTSNNSQTESKRKKNWSILGIFSSPSKQRRRSDDSEDDEDDEDE